MQERKLRALKAVSGHTSFPVRCFLQGIAGAKLQLAKTLANE